MDRIKAGMERIASVKRIITILIKPLKYPAIKPRVVPITRPIALDKRLAMNDIRAPYMIREKTSRPNASVPKRNSAHGERNFAPQNSVGEYLASRGAKIAITMNIRT